MTLQEIRESDAAFLLVTDVNKVVGCCPEALRLAARQHPEWLGFPVTVIDTRTYIPRGAFLEYIDGKKKEEIEAKKDKKERTAAYYARRGGVTGRQIRIGNTALYKHR